MTEPDPIVTLDDLYRRLTVHHLHTDRLIRALSQGEHEIMATLDDLKTKADTLNAALADMDARLTAEEAGETATSQAAIDAAAAALDTAIGHVQGEAAAPPAS